MSPPEELRRLAQVQQVHFYTQLMLQHVSEPESLHDLPPALKPQSTANGHQSRLARQRIPGPRVLHGGPRVQALQCRAAL